MIVGNLNASEQILNLTTFSSLKLQGFDNMRKRALVCFKFICVFYLPLLGGLIQGILFLCFVSLIPKEIIIYLLTELDGGFILDSSSVLSETFFLYISTLVYKPT